MSYIQLHIQQQKSPTKSNSNIYFKWDAQRHLEREYTAVAICAVILLFLHTPSIIHSCTTDLILCFGSEINLQISELILCIKENMNLHYFGYQAVKERGKWPNHQPAIQFLLYAVLPFHFRFFRTPRLSRSRVFNAELYLLGECVIFKCLIITNSFAILFISRGS